MMRMSDISTRTSDKTRICLSCCQLRSRWTFVTWRGQRRTRVSALSLSINADRPDCCSDQRVIDSVRLNYVATTSLRIRWRHRWRRSLAPTRQRWSRLHKRLSAAANSARHRPPSTFDGVVPRPVATLRDRHRGVQIKWRPDVVAGLRAASSCIASATNAHPGGRAGVDPSLESPGPSLIRASLVRPVCTPPYRHRLRASNSRDLSFAKFSAPQLRRDNNRSSGRGRV